MKARVHVLATVLTSCWVGGRPAFGRGRVVYINHKDLRHLVDNPLRVPTSGSHRVLYTQAYACIICTNVVVCYPK